MEREPKIAAAAFAMFQAVRATRQERVARLAESAARTADDEMLVGEPKAKPSRRFFGLGRFGTGR